jgi:hypothetical protein
MPLDSRNEFILFLFLFIYFFIIIIIIIILMMEYHPKKKMENCIIARSAWCKVYVIFFPVIAKQMNSFFII